MAFKTNIIAVSIACFAGLGLYSQPVVGHVLDAVDRPLAGASVYWMSGSGGTVSDAEGYYSLEFSASPGDKLIARFEGFANDTLAAEPGAHVDFWLSQEVDLETVKIEDKNDGTFISSIEAAQTEIITRTELGKAACCDLGGCFETQATVQAVTTNVITNSKELRVLGLSGYYNQVLIEGFPLIQGLSYTYGISSVPGNIIDKIYVSKGANSVLQGYESMTGQLNVILRRPLSTEKLFLNVYANSFGESQYNAQVATAVGERKLWSTLFAVHSAQPGGRFDRDKDNFLDVTRIGRYSLFNTWYYRGEDSVGLSVKVGGILTDETRSGGQVNYDPEIHRGSDSVYGQHVHYRQPAGFTKLTYRFNENMRLAVFASGLLHWQDSWFGITRYKANQYGHYGNAQMEMRYAGEQMLKVGISYRHLDQEENISFSRFDSLRTYDGIYSRRERTPGAFVDNTFYLFEDRITLITGFRADHHQQFGWFLTPKAVVKWDIREGSTFRAAAGFGNRLVNVFSENINLLASMRNVIFEQAPQPERSFNWGGSFTQKVTGEKVDGSLTLDFYSTSFTNQVFPDYDRSSTEAIITNFTGISRSNSFQAEANARFFKVVSIKAAYNYLDVYRMHGGMKMALPFNAKHRLMGSFSFMPIKEQWHLDANVHWFGPQRLASTLLNPEEYQTPAWSDAYGYISGQFTWAFKNFDLYGGCDNIFDFRQLKPIVAWQQPFSPWFDTSNVWGPTRGREIYVGFRYMVK